ncbi:hypothetical protein [Clostridium sp. AM58-1XD]|uniref:hypothetical protein n=1 Tax=Clostridium sp. AM58-1XD TaxID=2292307 RepID=UPI0011C1B5FC|nr:hypothetical protein [Clostridium sp. AM58-1XD]
MSIDYDIDSLEQRQPGFFLLYGTVESTEQYYVPPEIADVTFPIFLYDPANPCEMPVQEVSPIVSPTLSLPEGASQELLASSLAKNYNINFRLDGGVFWSAPLAWNPEDVDLSVPGNYTVTGTPQLPEGILLPEEFSSVSCEVCVQSGLIKVSHVIAAGSQSLITADLAYAEEQVSHALANPNDSYLKAAVKLENGTRTIFPVKYHTGPLSEARTGLFVLDGKSNRRKAILSLLSWQKLRHWPFFMILPPLANCLS